ncbi:tetratricopeptide repeat protein [Nitrospira sp. M1]
MKIVNGRGSEGIRVLFLLIWACSLIGAGSGAITFSEELSQEQIFQNEVKKLTEKGFFFYKQKEYLKAINSFTKALQLTDEPYEILLYRANVYLQHGQHEKALTDATTAIQIRPKDPLGYQLRASIFARNNHPHKGLEDLTNAINLNPILSENYVRRGDTYLILGEPQKALDDLSKAIELGRRNHLVFRYRAYALEQLGQYKQAIDDYSKALRFRSWDSPSLIGRGWIHGCLGDLEEAIADFSEVLIKNPSHLAVRLQRAITYSDIGNLESAEADLIYGVRQGVKNPEYYLYLADVYYRQGKLDKAIDINKKIELLKNENSLSPMYLQRGLLYLQQGKIVDSKKFYQEGLELAEKYLDMEEVNEAIQEFKALAIQYPKQLNAGQEILSELEAAKKRMALIWKPDINSCSAIKAAKDGA